MQIIYKKLSELHPYANNPRVNDNAVEAVANSIKEFGFKNPIVATSDGEIVNGHTRFKAANKLGLAEVPVIIADDLSEEQIKAFRLADNKTSELADWNFELLNIELSEIDDIDMSEFGFELDEEELIEDDKDLDEFDESLPEEPSAKLGDIYQLGRHKLMCGDSTDVSMVEALMGGTMVDLLVTDPPYNVAYEGKTKDALKIENDNMEDEAFRRFLTSAFYAAKMKPVGLFDYQIRNNTKELDVVLDLFGGSGTTLIACEDNGRTAYLMEYDPRYVDVIIKRWEEMTGQKAEIIKKGENKNV